ncbi:MAG: glycosyltransferase family 2 protein [Ketobacteraceae bacterium]|nr:glycosyltransferase family 2 protein [Ketobacteraceae bacterium]
MTNVTGWLGYLCLLGLLALSVPDEVFVPGSEQFILLIGAVGIWRYGVGFTHFIRGMIFLYLVFPRARKKALLLGDEAAPSHVYLMVTSFRIDALTTASVYDSVIKEAIDCGWPATIVCSIVELGDENIIRDLWRRHNPPERVALKIVRIPGTGKRDGLAYGFRAISRDMPDEQAIVAVIDGDTVLNPGVVKESAPYFHLYPKMGALTTNEFCSVEGSYVMSQWHKLRFAQRHINMCSMALSNRVLTLTGRMSVFRASVVTDPSFISDVEHDHIHHRRLGQFRFLTGDDKSSWFSLMRLGYDTWYVPSASINTVEHPPDKNFFRASRKLMFRWYGNSLRQNSRATRLGIKTLGLFTYYILWDQRFSMWTSLLGLVASIVASIKYSYAYFLIYILWITLTRLVLTVLLMMSGHRIGPIYPVMLYYNQIVGSLMKIYVYFRLDQQSWTRQNTKLKRSTNAFQSWFNHWSTRAYTFSSVSVFLALIFYVV